MLGRKITCLKNAYDGREASVRVRVLESRESELSGYSDFTLQCMDGCGSTAITTNAPTAFVPSGVYDLQGTISEDHHGKLFLNTSRYHKIS